MRFGWLGGGRLLLGLDLAEEAQRPGLQATLLRVTRQGERTLSLSHGYLYATR
jgi:hypothetical protein